jgi:ring-1,2-phenylacetyl-CoA epoxidase subunit PaaB
MLHLLDGKAIMCTKIRYSHCIPSTTASKIVNCMQEGRVFPSIIDLRIMPTITSLDPRITRAQLPADQEQPFDPKEPMDQFQTFEVFVQSKTGGHHAHVGSVHAPTPEIAMSYAKEQYGRRGQTFNIWVVETSHIHVLDQSDADFFETVPEKGYREVAAYAKIRDKVEAFKKNQG